MTKLSNHQMDTVVQASNGVTVTVHTRHLVGTFTTSILTSDGIDTSVTEVNKTPFADRAIKFHNDAVKAVGWIVRRDAEKTVERIAGEIFAQKVTRNLFK